MGKIMIIEEKADKIVDKLEMMKDCVEEMIDCFAEAMECHRYPEEDDEWDDFLLGLFDEAPSNTL